MQYRMLVAVAAVSLLFSAALRGQTAAPQVFAPASNLSQGSVLNALEAAKLMPATVFFQGQNASIQGRNSAGVRFGDKSLMLASLVDTSGYSSRVQEKYQAYLITESALTIDGHSLPPGAYGCGFIGGDSFLVMDLGGHDLFSAHSTRDKDLHRPMPLQIVKAPDAPDNYRLYAGRDYVSFHLANAR
jgi:hypothetical protein